MGRVHAAAYAKLPDVSLVGIVDSDREAAEALARVHGVPATYSDLTTALHDVACDVVDLCVPTHLHSTYAVAAAERGKHVICEKPIARTLDQARAMLDACRTYGVQLLVGHVVRFFPNFVRAKALMESGRIGQVAVARMFRGGQFPRGWDDWYRDVDRSGGVMLDLMIHDFDFLRWTFGPVARVYAKSVHDAAAPLAYALCTLRFQSGVIAHVEGSWAHEGFSTRFEFAGSQGILEEDSRYTAPLWVHERASAATGRAADGGGAAAGGVAVPLSPVFVNPYEAEIDHFIRVIRGEETPRVTAMDAYEALRIALACAESAQTGRPVALGD